MYFSCPNSTESFSIIDMHIIENQNCRHVRMMNEKTIILTLMKISFFLCKIIQEKVKSGSDSDIAQRAAERIIYSKQNFLFGGGGSLFQTSQYFQDGML